MGNSINEVKKVFETYELSVVNKLLNTSDCILLRVATEVVNDEENPKETVLLYSIGQVKYGICATCKKRTLEYNVHEHVVWGICKNGCRGNIPL